MIMFKELKERIQIRKTEKAARIILMNKLSELVEKEAQAKQIEIEMMNKLNVEFDNGSLNDTLGIISAFTDNIKTNPNLNQDLMDKIHDDAHAERMAEIEKQNG